ncbi:MAG: hypothetical protein ABR529_04360 [Actinomycetota bacterium]
MIELLPAELLDSLVLGGHTGYGKELRESRGEDGEGGIGMAWIVAVLLLAVGTVGLLVWVSSSSTRAKLKKVAPGVLIAAVMATPLMVWTATSGVDDDQSLVVERATSPTGAPEFIVSLAEDDLNTLGTTNGKRAVRVECLSREGQVVLQAKQRWPFDNEPGYEYPHAHQAASSEQLRRADRCRLQGTHVRLDADVEGALTG